VKSYKKKIELSSSRQFELIDVTDHVAETVKESGIRDGFVLAYSPHTTAAIRINHNEPLLVQDIMKMLYRLVPLETSYSHDLFEMRQNIAVNERSNGHAHVKAFLLGSSETIPLTAGLLDLGEKQSIFFVECDGARPRDFIVSIIGE
jgi:secondary thiamine-phosphate synthase enzyme